MYLLNILFILLFTNYNCIYGFYNYKKINNLSNCYSNIKNNIIKKQYLRQNDIPYKIIYYKYEKYALSKAIEFKNKYRIYLKNNEELYLYSRIGLHKAIINYDFTANTSFFNYLQKYVNGELYNYMTDKYSLSIMPKYIRKKIKMNEKTQKCLPILFHDNWYFDKIQYNQDDYNQINLKYIWELIYRNLDFNSYFIFKSKYDYNFNIIRSNLNISKLLGVNEEYVRLNLLMSKNIIKNKLEKG